MEEVLQASQLRIRPPLSILWLNNSRDCLSLNIGEILYELRKKLSHDILCLSNTKHLAILGPLCLDEFFDFQTFHQDSNAVVMISLVKLNSNGPPTENIIPSMSIHFSMCSNTICGEITILHQLQYHA